MIKFLGEFNLTLWKKTIVNIEPTPNASQEGNTI